TFGVAPATLACIEVGQGRFDEAEHWLERAEQVLRPDVEPAAELLLHLLRGALLSAKGRDEEAIDAFRASERRQTLLVAPHALRVATRGFLAQALVRVGDMASARTTLAEGAEEDRDWGEARAARLSDILDVLAGSSLAAPAGERPELREELSESELRVLRVLPSNLSAPEIGRELYLSLSTIKTHMRHIYAKLGVHRRTEAVDRARELGLLAPSARRR